MIKYKISFGFEIISHANVGEVDKKHYILCSCGYVEKLISDDETDAEERVAEIKEFAESGEMIYYCPECGKQSYYSNRKREIILDYKDNKLIASIDLNYGDEILSLKWMKDWLVLNGVDDYKERIVFNFSRGTTYMELTTKDGKILHTVDITNCAQILREDPIIKMFWNNNTFRDYIYECFRDRCDGVIPIVEPDLMELVQINRFNGYNADFIYSVPYLKHTYCIPDEFKYNAFRTKEKAQSCIEKLDFSKSIKKCFFEKPAYLFYVDEIKEIDRILCDVNLLRTFLGKEKRSFEILAAFKQYPCLREFFEGYINENGKSEFLALVRRFYSSVIYSAMEYQLFNEHVKKRAKDIFSKNKCFDLIIIEEHPNLVYSIPVRFNLQEWEYRYKNYTFRWLRNTNDFSIAGKELDNCLEGIRGLDNVMTISYNGKMIAAAELKNNHIQYCFYAHNRFVFENDDICEAIRAWCGQFGIVGAGTVIKKRW